MRGETSTAATTPPDRSIFRRVLRGVLWLPLVVGRAMFVWERTDIGDRRTHIMYLLMFVGMLMVPALMTYDPVGDEHVSVGPVKLPGICLSRQVFHVSCPGCNLTRAFVCLTHGEFREAVSQHRISILLYAFFVGQVAFRGYCLLRRGRPVPWTLLGVNHYVSVALIALLMGNWVAGLFLGGNGS
jgi:hypothetical protein